MKIEVITLAGNGSQTDYREFDTMKEARYWIKYAALESAYWERASESESFASTYVYTVQLHKNGEIVQDWFPDFK